MMLHDNMKASILDVCRLGGNIKNFFVFEHIPQKKLNNAFGSYASSMSSDEVVIFLYDDTVFGSAKEGFILTSKRLYYKNIGFVGDFSDIVDILDLTVRHTMLQSRVTVRTSFKNMDIQITQADQKQALFGVLNETITFLKNLKIDHTVSTGQAPSASRSPICRGCGAYNGEYASRCEYCDSPLY